MVVRIMSLLAAILIITIGVLHISSSIKKWCDSDVAKYDDQTSCFGPQLFWSKRINHKATSSDLNTQWRTVFTFAPDNFVDLWTPLILGMISLFMHIGALRWNSISSNWLTTCVWYLMCSLFGCFGYAGQMGIFGGLYVVLVSFCSLVMNFVSPAEKPHLEAGDYYTPLNGGK